MDFFLSPSSPTKTTLHSRPIFKATMDAAARRNCVKYLAFLTVTELFFRRSWHLEIICLFVQLQDKQPQQLLSGDRGGRGLQRRRWHIVVRQQESLKGGRRLCHRLVFAFATTQSFERAGELGQGLGGRRGRRGRRQRLVGRGVAPQKSSLQLGKAKCKQHFPKGLCEWWWPRRPAAPQNIMDGLSRRSFSQIQITPTTTKGQH